MTGDKLPLVHWAMISITTYTPGDKPTIEERKEYLQFMHTSKSVRLINEGLGKGTHPVKKDCEQKTKSF